MIPQAMAGTVVLGSFCGGGGGLWPWRAAPMSGSGHPNRKCSGPGRRAEIAAIRDRVQVRFNLDPFGAKSDEEFQSPVTVFFGYETQTQSLALAVRSFGRRSLQFAVFWFWRHALFFRSWRKAS